ncbi:MAG TPA: alkaline phosphatase family protein [Solirubrobacteraceae bacterium]|nr:alkaline phosphatase family protein [Solirubrobacteraceae bacterium]
MGVGGEQGRCGFGPRLPLLLIPPYARHNYVDHNLSDQSSIINFIEHNWHLPAIPGSYDQALAATDRREGVPFDLAGLFDFRGPTNKPLFQNPTTGEPEPWWAH